MGWGMRQVWLLLVVAGALLAACPATAQTTEQTTEQTTKEAVAASCVGSDLDFEDPKARELICLGELGDRVSRKGNVLSLKLDDGRTRAFRSDPKACQNDDASHCENYYLVGFHPSSGRYLVYGTYYESSDCKMVSVRTGRATSFLDVPHFAPDGQTFFVTGVDGTYDNWLGVGSMTTDPPALQWRNQADPNVYWKFVRWVDNDQIELSTHKKGETCSDGNCDSVLKRAADGWMLDRVQPKSDPR